MKKQPLMISRGMVYGKQLDELVWHEREKWAVWGVLAGALLTNIIWIVALSF